MAYSRAFNLALVAAIATCAFGCSNLVYKRWLPDNIETFITDTSIFPLKVYWAYEEQTAGAAAISCYSIDKDFVVKAYSSSSGLQQYSATPISKAVDNTTYKVTYKIPTQYFLGTHTVNDTVTFRLQAATRDIILWEVCSGGSYETHWATLKADGDSDAFDPYCMRDALQDTTGKSPFIRKGIC